MCRTRAKKIFTQKCCKICDMITTDIEDMNKFHGRVCRICYNKSRVEPNKANRIKNEDYHRAYGKVWNRERYRKQKEEATGKEVKIRCLDTIKPTDIKVKDFKP